MIVVPERSSRGTPTANSSPVPHSCAKQCLFITLWALAHFLHARSFVFSKLQTLLPKTPGGIGGSTGYRSGKMLTIRLLRTYRRRIGGRCEVKARGRIRNLGAKGGGTFRRKSPQQGQRPSCEVAAVASARNQWPRASHSWLMH